jgi:hypothetical protein
VSTDAALVVFIAGHAVLLVFVLTASVLRSVPLLMAAPLLWAALIVWVVVALPAAPETPPDCAVTATARDERCSL